MKYIPSSVTSVVGRTILKTQAKSPTLLFAAGVVGVVGTVVLASRATLKLDRMLESIQLDKMELEQGFDHNSDEDHFKDQAFFYARTTLEVAKLYAPTVAVGAISIGCLTGAHNILSKRNLALTAAYASIEQTFNEYRRRVSQELGQEKDLEYRYGSQTVEESVLDSKGKLVVKETKRAPQTLVSPLYARFFDETCPSWNRRQDYNMTFLELQQSYWNNRLNSRGHVFLNEVYDSLGFERTQAGQIMGWILTKDHSTDEHVDFGLFDGDKERVRAFVNGYESAILLDFNVTNIYDRL